PRTVERLELRDAVAVGVAVVEVVPTGIFLESSCGEMRCDDERGGQDEDRSKGRGRHGCSLLARVYADALAFSLPQTGDSGAVHPAGAPRRATRRCPSSRRGSVCGRPARTAATRTDRW